MNPVGTPPDAEALTPALSRREREQEPREPHGTGVTIGQCDIVAE